MCNDTIACAVDPGINGGIAVVSKSDIYITHRMPVFEIEIPPKKKGGKVRKQKQIDFDKFLAIITESEDIYDPINCIEDITHLYGLPSTTNFRLGYAVGMAHAVLQSFGDFYLVGPKKWQQLWQNSDLEYMKDKKGKAVMVKRGKGLFPKKDTKATSLNCAKRLYPDYDFSELTDGEIDAILIARYYLEA